MIYSKEKYDPQVLKRLQDTEMEILDVVVDFCRKNNLNYSLAYGTLLGAIRHKGFIPWDDDVDIMMLREDYEKFRQLWLQNPIDGYDIVDDQLYDDYHENFMKIRKSNTTFVQFDSEKTEHLPLGIFIDILPFDRVAPSRVTRKLQHYCCLLNMLLTRNRTSNSSNVLVSIAENMILSLPVGLRVSLKLRLRKYIQKWNDNDRLPLFNNVSLVDLPVIFDKDLFDEFENAPFDGRIFKIIQKYDMCLTHCYGDYMQLPPEEKRYSHYPLILDFEHCYDEIRGEII